MHIFLPRLSGVIVIILVHVKKPILCQELNSCPSSGCNCSSTADNQLYANCFNSTFTVLPTDLGDVQILNISLIRFERLTKLDMNQYPSIVELNMYSTEMIENLEKFDLDFLLPLKKLKILNISNINLLRPPILLPPTITNLYASAMSRNVSFLDFSVLQNLTYLEMNYCYLHGLPPSLPKESPLQYLLLRNNYLNNLTYSRLADYCLLKTLEANESHLNKSESFYDCCDLVVWLNEHNVTNSIDCEFNATTTQCETGKYYKPDPRAAEAYEQCLRRNGLEKEKIEIQVRAPFSWLLVLIFFCGFVAVLLVVSACYKSYKYFKSKKAAAGKVDDQSNDEEINEEAT